METSICSGMRYKLLERKGSILSGYNYEPKMHYGPCIRDAFFGVLTFELLFFWLLVAVQLSQSTKSLRAKILKVLCCRKWMIQCLYRTEAQ